MGEWDGVTFSYISQCSVCKKCKGKGCDALSVQQRETKYYMQKDKDFSKCPEFIINENSPNAELFLKLSKKYDWKKKGLFEIKFSIVLFYAVSYA